MTGPRLSTLAIVGDMMAFGLLALINLITFKLGDVTIFSETPDHRRRLMYNRFGFDAPSGVYVYDAISDFVLAATVDKDAK